ncbi:hypothetical protein EVAR_84777_1 [Eumeta japonica]|uniref:Uncharacterized protein n=1 Tax=Eumeta variegata TaxID=151549 RepID=A0A4C1U880_EUMVA|nr:hypothetical protein EVAR_84777_1 [Eumeta japonica]
MHGSAVRCAHRGARSEGEGGRGFSAGGRVVPVAVHLLLRCRRSPFPPRPPPSRRRRCNPPPPHAPHHPTSPFPCPPARSNPHPTLQFFVRRRSDSTCASHTPSNVFRGDLYCRKVDSRRIGQSLKLIAPTAIRSLHGLGFPQPAASRGALESEPPGCCSPHQRSDCLFGRCAFTPRVRTAGTNARLTHAHFIFDKIQILPMRRGRKMKNCCVVAYLKRDDENTCDVSLIDTAAALAEAPPSSSRNWGKARSEIYRRVAACASSVPATRPCLKSWRYENYLFYTPEGCRRNSRSAVQMHIIAVSGRGGRVVGVRRCSIVRPAAARLVSRTFSGVVSASSHRDRPASARRGIATPMLWQRRRYRGAPSLAPSSLRTFDRDQASPSRMFD